MWQLVTDNETFGGKRQNGNLKIGGKRQILSIWTLRVVMYNGINEFSK